MQEKHQQQQQQKQTKTNKKSNYRGAHSKLHSLQLQLETEICNASRQVDGIQRKVMISDLECACVHCTYVDSEYPVEV